LFPKPIEKYHISHVIAVLVVGSLISCGYAYAQNTQKASDKTLMSFGSIDQPALYTENENVYAFWNKETEEDNFAFLKRSPDSGTSFGKSSNLAASYELPGISSSDNNLFIAWEDENYSPDHSVIEFERSIDYGANFEEPIIISDKSVDSTNPKVISLGDHVYIAWQSAPYNDTSNSDIFFRSSNDGGVTFGDTINLSNSPGNSEFDSSDEYSVQLAADGSNVYVIWKDSQYVPLSITSNPLSITSNPHDLSFAYSNDYGKTFHTPSVLTQGEFTTVFVRSFEKNVYVAADEYGTSKDVVLFTSRDTGGNFSEPQNLSNNTESEPTSDTQFLLDKNNLYFLWARENENEAAEDIQLTASYDKGLTFEKTVDVSPGIYANYKSVDYWENAVPIMAVAGPSLYIIWDNIINTLDFDEIHNLLIRGSNDYGKTFDVPKVVSRDIGDSSLYDVKAGNQSAFILYMDSPVKYTSESEEDNYELFFKKTSVSSQDLENAKLLPGGNPKEITVSISALNDPLMLGEKQVLNVAVSDAMTDEPLKGADVDVTVDYNEITEKHFSGKTDEIGKVSFTWTIGKYNIPGTYSAEALVSAEGYASTSDDIEFEVESESEDQ